MRAQGTENTFCWDLDAYKALGTTVGYLKIMIITAWDSSAHHVLFPCFLAIWR